MLLSFIAWGAYFRRLRLYPLTVTVMRSGLFSTPYIYIYICKFMLLSVERPEEFEKNFVAYE